jgi:predicted helicase
MTEADNRIDYDFFQDNSMRVLEQNDLDITVIVGNPPYSAGQTNANDNNANEHYPTLDDRIRQTYSAGSKATNKNSIMDSYIRAFRWASDRVVRNGDGGIVCLLVYEGKNGTNEVSV